jgi:radical SAM protein with 4Fe4S-binding SPASM domain
MTIHQLFPSHVEWQLTVACDLNCVHCHARGTHGPDLSQSDALSLVDTLAERGVRAVTLSGGEPFLRDDWCQVAGSLTAAGVDAQIISNGQHITAEVAEELVRARVSFVWLSVDGDEAVHDRIRRKAGAHRRLLESAARLAAADVPFGAMTTALAPNGDQLDAIGESVFAMGAERWQVWLGNPCNTEDIWLTPFQAREVTRTLLTLRRGFPHLIIGDNVGYGGELERLRHPENPSQANAGFHFAGCYAAGQVLGITNSGALKGCLALPGAGIDTAGCASFEDALARVRIQVQKERKKELWHCRGCAKLPTCNGGCLAHAMAASGTGHRSCYVGTPPGRLKAVMAASLLSAVACASECQPVDETAQTPPAAETEAQQEQKPEPAPPAPPSAPAKAEKNAVTPEKPAPGKDNRVENARNKAPGNRSPNENFLLRPCSMSHVGCRDDRPPAILKSPEQGEGR